MVVNTEGGLKKGLDIMERVKPIFVKYDSGLSGSSVMVNGTSFFSEFIVRISVPYFISFGKQKPFGVRSRHVSGIKTFNGI